MKTANANKVPMTFRLSAELAKRIRDDAAKSGGRLSQVDLIEKALEDRYVVKDGAAMLAKVHTSQQETLTKLTEQTESMNVWKTAINDAMRKLREKEAEVAELRTMQNTARVELAEARAAITAFSNKMASIETTLERVNHRLRESAEQRLSILSLFGTAGLVCLSIIGLVSAVSLIVMRVRGVL